MSVYLNCAPARGLWVKLSFQLYLLTVAAVAWKIRGMKFRFTYGKHLRQKTTSTIKKQKTKNNKKQNKNNNNNNNNKKKQKTKNKTVEPFYYGHQGDRNKCPYYRGVHFREVGFIWILVSQGPSELSVIERCP